MPNGTGALSTYLLPPEWRNSVPLLAFAGGGGKTTALFALAYELADSGASVLITTTTHILDPRGEGRRLDAFRIAPELASGASIPLASALGAPGDGPGLPGGLGGRRGAGRGSVSVLCAGVEDGKLTGIAPAAFPALAASGLWDAILAEADGSKGRPVKAPSSHEPAWPDGVSTAVGVIGLDCLGALLDESTAHRPRILASLVGLGPQGRMGEGELLRLALHPEGLFRLAPEGSRRVLLLNKADLVPELSPNSLALRVAKGLARVDDGGWSRVDAVLVCRLSDPDPERRVLAAREVFP